MSKQYPNLVPYGDKTQSLGTTEKAWDKLYAGTVSADEFDGGLKDIIDSLATKVALSTVEGMIKNASSPNYYSADTPFSAKTSVNRTTIATPNILWLNINNKGHKLLEQLTMDIDDPSVWDTKATAWAGATKYNVGDYVYTSSPTATYMYICTTAGTSSTLTPTFPTTVDSTYNDGSVVWKCVLNYSGAVNRAGKDFYIYAIYSDTNTPTFTITANSTVPTGYTAETSRKVGGFHCLCADVGTISGHTLSDYVAGDILPCSVWDLSHRPKSEPEGMVYVEGIDMWVDIYLCSWEGTTADKTLKTISQYGAVIADGTSTEKFHPLKFEQTMLEQKKRLPWVREFRTFSLGSNNGTNIKGSADPNTTGGHVDTAGRRMISYYGIEDCCGTSWQWCSDVGCCSTGSASWTAGYSNDRSDVGGQIYGTEYRPLVGGPWGDGAHCGSRAAFWDGGSLALYASSGARGASEPLGR